MGTEGTYLNLMKVTCDNPAANIILTSKKLKPFPLRIRQGFSLFPLLFDMVLEVLATAIKQEKEMKGIQIGREEAKLSLCAETRHYIWKTLNAPANHSHN